MKQSVSLNQIEKRYKKLLEDVATDDFYKVDLTKRVNCYICDTCRHITKTKDVDAGVTPAFFSCEKCGELARSTFYKDVAPTQKPTFEWYRPGLEKVFKMRKRQGLLDHILAGGLAHRKIEK